MAENQSEQKISDLLDAEPNHSECELEDWKSENLEKWAFFELNRPPSVKAAGLFSASAAAGFHRNADEPIESRGIGEIGITGLQLPLRMLFTAQQRKSHRVTPDKIMPD